MSARAYLIDRFRGDATTLRDRAVALAGGAVLPGPDLTTSQHMADACATVVRLLESLPPTDEAHHEVAALRQLIPTLESQARAVTHLPVRAVYAGAVTRIREVEAAERAAEARSGDAP